MTVSVARAAAPPGGNHLSLEDSSGHFIGEMPCAAYCAAHRFA